EPVQRVGRERRAGERGHVALAASSAASEAVRPSRASCAARMPLCAAWPAWYGFVIEPKFSLSPDAIEAAMPRAWRVWLTSSPRSLDAAAAQPRVPMVEVACQPRV